MIASGEPPYGKPVLYSRRYAAKEHQDTITTGNAISRVTKGCGAEPVRARPLHGCAPGEHCLLGTQREAAALRRVAQS